MRDEVRQGMGGTNAKTSCRLTSIVRIIDAARRDDVSSPAACPKKQPSLLHGLLLLVGYRLRTMGELGRIVMPDEIDGVSCLVKIAGRA